MIVFFAQVVWASMAAAFALLAATLAVCSASALRDKEGLYSTGERLFQGIFGIILCVFCTSATALLTYLCISFPDLV